MKEAMRLGTCDGLIGRIKLEILGAMCMLLTGIRNTVYQTLFVSTPTLVYHGVANCINRVTLLKCSRVLTPTWDLLNCGPRHRFCSPNLILSNCQFGAGARKVHSQLTEDGVNIEFDEVKIVHNTYWAVFARLKAYSQELQIELARNGGIAANGLNRPMCIPEECQKDVLSRVIQSTGHDLLVKYVSGILSKELTKEGIQWKPVLIDLHDATTFQVPSYQVEKTKQIFIKSLNLLNKQIDGTLKISGKPTSGKSLAECKEVEE